MENKILTPLEVALDVRKFEIGLYWKRATYFWTFIAATLVGYTTISTSEQAHKLVLVKFLLTTLGLLFSLSWYLVNRGSKFWQENWEEHVRELQEPVIGKLFTSFKAPHKISFWNLTGSYWYSVSKINQLLSLYVFLVWVILFGSEVISYFCCLQVCCCNESIIFVTITVLAITFLAVIVAFGRSSETIRSDTKISSHK
jgi:hypothetical protein